MARRQNIPALTQIVLNESKLEMSRNRKPQDVWRQYCLRSVKKWWQHKLSVAELDEHHVYHNETLTLAALIPYQPLMENPRLVASRCSIWKYSRQVNIIRDFNLNSTRQNHDKLSRYSDKCLVTWASLLTPAKLKQLGQHAQRTDETNHHENGIQQNPNNARGNSVVNMK